ASHLLLDVRQGSRPQGARARDPLRDRRLAGRQRSQTIRRLIRSTAKFRRRPLCRGRFAPSLHIVQRSTASSLDPRSLSLSHLASRLAPRSLVLPSVLLVVLVLVITHARGAPL